MRRLLLASTMLCTALLPVAAEADPISMAAASVAASYVAGGGMAAFGGVSFLGIAAGTAEAAFFQFAIRAALGYAMSALSPKSQNAIDGSPAGRSYDINSLGPALPQAVIYGETVVGGAIFYQTTTGASSEYLHRCIAFCAHEIEAFVEIYFNNEPISWEAGGNVTYPEAYADKARVVLHYGYSDQAADPDLVAEVSEWTTNHRARGIAYLYVRFSGASSYSGGAPTVTAKIRGKKIYDPRSGTSYWSSNPALVLRDYISADYGLREAASEIDDLAFIAAANICDELVSGAPRYTCDGGFLLDATPHSVVTGILSSMGGMFWFAQGKWGCKAAAYVTPEIDFDEHDLRGDINIATRNSRRDNFNRVTGVYKGAETEWQESEFEPVTNATYLSEDNGIENSIEMQLLFTRTEATARRIAQIALKRNRQQLTVSAPFGLRALQVGIGDTIRLTNARAGWTNKVFEVNDWRFAMTREMDLQVNLLLREIDSSVFT